MTTAASSSDIALITPIESVKGIAASRAAAFRGLGIRCVADLLLHLPMRYELETAEDTIEAASKVVGPNHSATANVALRGDIATVRVVGGRGRRGRTEITLHDGTATMKVTWFNQPWLAKRIHPGETIRIWGEAKRYGDYLTMANPRWEHIPDDEDRAPREARLAPVYPANEKLSSYQIEKVIEPVLEPALALLADHLPDEYRRGKAMPTLADAYRMLHRPSDDDEVAAARRRLAFDELLMLQLAVMMKRWFRRSHLSAPALALDAKIDDRIRDRLPFNLTADQNQVVEEIAADLQSDRPMNRLLQGDVGSGKTAVALYAMLMAVASGHQAALMAPTELLAEQHLASITAMLRGGRVTIELLTGSLKKAHRNDVLARLAAGEIDILIGTHALLTEHVGFDTLALAVIDEQHRFGVHQRATLRSKAADERTVPHTLVMTATPIPRTLSQTLFGDLDLSTIHELPPGRMPITTQHFAKAEQHAAYDVVKNELAAGGQAYIVVPVIDESAAGLTDVQNHIAWLNEGILRAYRMEVMHGRVSRDDRESIMRQFRAGEIDALVATTVIEVGVDVPNASIMVIENADRFGLAQLHQLRGRVGRGDRASQCLIIADPLTEDGEKRIAAMLETTNGFRIAERDLEIRGPGEMFGAKQSGLPPFRVADLSNPKHIDLLKMARRDAIEWINENPTLAGERDALLRKRLLKAYGEVMGIGDVA